MTEIRIAQFLELGSLAQATEGLLRREHHSLLDLIPALIELEGDYGPAFNYLRDWGEISLDQLRAVLPVLLVALSKVLGREVTVLDLVAPPESDPAG